MSDQAIEQQIQANGLNTAPRLTPTHIEEQVRSEFFFTAADGVLGESQLGTSAASWTKLDQVTICVLILRNGHKVVGINPGPVSAANFDAGMGREMARQDAIDQVWMLEGYLLRQRLYDATAPQIPHWPTSVGEPAEGTPAQ